MRHILPYSSGNIDPHTTEDTIGYGFVQDYWYETLVTFDFGNGTADWRIAAGIIPWLAEERSSNLIQRPMSFRFGRASNGITAIR